MVMNLIVADMLAGGIFTAQTFLTLGRQYDCKFSIFTWIHTAVRFPLISLPNIAMISLQQHTPRFVHSSIGSSKGGAAV